MMMHGSDAAGSGECGKREDHRKNLSPVRFLTTVIWYHESVR